MIITIFKYWHKDQESQLLMMILPLVLLLLGSKDIPQHLGANPLMLPKNKCNPVLNGFSLHLLSVGSFLAIVQLDLSRSIVFIGVVVLEQLADESEYVAEGFVVVFFRDFILSEIFLEMVTVKHLLLLVDQTVASLEGVQEK